MIPVEEIQPGDVVDLPDGRTVEVSRVDRYPADPELAARGLVTYATDAIVVTWRRGDGTETELAIKRPGDLLDARHPADYTRQARDAAAGQTRSPRLADNPAAAPATSPPLARSSDPETSHAAARSIRAQELRQSQEDVLYVFKRHGPMDDVELVSRYLELAHARAVRSQSPSGIRTRRHELVTAGQVRDTGRTVRLETGRRATVWERVESLALTIDQEYDPEPPL